MVILPKEGLLLLTPSHLYNVHIPVVIREVKGFMLILDKILYSTGTGRVGEIYQFIPVVFPLPPFTSYSPIQIKKNIYFILRTAVLIYRNQLMYPKLVEVL